MKATKLSNLLTITGLISVLGHFAIVIMVGNGLPAPGAALNFLLVQPAIAIILLISSVPIIRYRLALKKFLDDSGSRPPSVDSNYAVRSVAFAKSVSLTGSVFVGWMLAILTYQLLAPQNPSPWSAVFGVLGAVSMTVSGLVVENLFRIPPDRDGEPS